MRSFLAIAATVMIATAAQAGPCDFVVTFDEIAARRCLKEMKEAADITQMQVDRLAMENRNLRGQVCILAREIHTEMGALVAEDACQELKAAAARKAAKKP